MTRSSPSYLNPVNGATCGSCIHCDCPNPYVPSALGMCDAHDRAVNIRRSTSCTDYEPVKLPVISEPVSKSDARVVSMYSDEDILRIATAILNEQNPKRGIKTREIIRDIVGMKSFSEHMSQIQSQKTIRHLATRIPIVLKRNGWRYIPISKHCTLWVIGE